MLNQNANILMVGPYPPPFGGIAVVVRDLLGSPISDSFNVRLLRETPSIHGGKLYRIMIDVINLVYLLITFKPNIVHIHTSYDAGWPKHISYAVIAKLWRKKVLLHLHAYHKKCSNDFPRIWLKRFVYPPRFVFNFIDFIFTLSDTDTKRISEYGFREKVKTIKNGVLLKRFKKKVVKIQNVKERISIIYMGTLESRKGIYELLKSMQTIFRILPKSRIIIAGDGPAKDDVLDSIKALPLELMKKVTFEGRVSEVKKVQLLKSADIFVLQSDNEGLPIAILEAIACGCAVVTTPVGSIPEIIMNMENGILIQPKDENALIDAIKVLHDNRELLHSMQIANHKLSLSYSWESRYREISEVYSNLLQI